MADARPRATPASCARPRHRASRSNLDIDRLGARYDEVERLQQRIFRASQQGQWRTGPEPPEAAPAESLEPGPQRPPGHASERGQTDAGCGWTGRSGRDAPGGGSSENYGSSQDARGPRRCRRVYIPKANGKLGRWGSRPLRIGSASMWSRRALEPAWAAHFEAHSYGFRPGRSTRTPSRLLWRRLHRRSRSGGCSTPTSGAPSTTSATRSSCAASGNFPARRQIARWLTAGYVEIGKLHPDDGRHAQGGRRSPAPGQHRAGRTGEPALGAASEAQGGTRTPAGYFGLARYADDFVVVALSRTAWRRSCPRSETWLAERGLELNDEKTRISRRVRRVRLPRLHVPQASTTGSAWSSRRRSKVLAKLREMQGLAAPA